MNTIISEDKDNQTMLDQETPAQAAYSCHECGFYMVDSSDDFDGFREACEDHERTCHSEDAAGPRKPKLRPTFTPDGEVAPWAHPCPSWCREAAEGGHLVEDLTRRRHSSRPLRVRQDCAYMYDAFENEGDSTVRGVQTGHLEVSLVCGSRQPELGQILIRGCVGNDKGEPHTLTLAPLFFDEARELIAVLEYFMAVADAEKRR